MTNNMIRWKLPIVPCWHIRNLIDATRSMNVCIKDDPFNGWFQCAHHNQSIKLTPLGPSEIRKGDYHYIFETYTDGNIPNQKWIKKHYPIKKQ